jgi:hypothetical protein
VERVLNVVAAGSRLSQFGLSWSLAVWLRKPPFSAIGFPWISLDSLVRIETYQWVTRILAEEISPRAFPLPFETRQREPIVEAMRKRRIAHRASLTIFLIIRKHLFALPSWIFGSKSCENYAVIASDRASRDAHPSGRATATRSRGTQGRLTTPGMLRRSASRNEDSA